jgi:ketosteroid isomerase-like protein
MHRFKWSRVVLALTVAAVSAERASAQSARDEVQAAVTAYNAAFQSKDLPTLRAMLADNLILYEHSIHSNGVQDAWEKHMKPELTDFINPKATFTNVRITAAGDVGVVTREYSIVATMKGNPIDARGNETMMWVKRNGRWLVSHIHYSHVCKTPTPG